MGRIDRFVEKDCRLSCSQLSALRVIWGLIALQAAGTLAHQFAAARTGAFFNLPLFDFWPLLPDSAHRAIVYSSFAFALLLLTGVAPRWGAWGMCGVLLYVLLSDHFAFRHVWVLLANIYFWIGMMASHRPIAPHPQGGPGGGQYSLFALRGFVSLVYLIAAFPKMNAEFFSGEVIRHLTTEHWGIDSLPGWLVNHWPLVCPLLAATSCLVEIYLALGLSIGRLRSSAFLIGLVFHTAVPVLAGVGHSLNLYFVAAYLFFAWNPGTRPGYRFQTGDRVSRWARRCDRLGRLEWQANASRVSLWSVASQTLYGNPFVVWYGFAWYALITIKASQSYWFLPACVAAVAVAGHELVWLFRSADKLSS